MNETALIFGGLIAAFLLLRSMLKSRTAGPAPTPRERDWGAFVDNLSRNPDPDVIQRQLGTLTDDELVDLHRWFGLSPPSTEHGTLADGVRTQLTLDIFRRILGL